MKHFLCKLLALLWILPLSAQVKELYPVLSNHPNLNPDSLAKYQALSEEYHRLIDADVAYEDMSPEQQRLLENELLYAEGPYFTGELGCSWYCATGPSNIHASSELSSQSGNSYAAELVHDFDFSTAWVEGAEDWGIGEELEISFKLQDHLKITDLSIYNGYCKSLQTWADNSRVKTLALYVNKQHYANLNLEDSYYAQHFKLGSLGSEEVENTTLTFIIKEVYKGDKYKDCAISEINFDGTGDH